MNKYIIPLLIIMNIITGVLLVLNKKEETEFKSAIINSYIINQLETSTFIENALDSYEDGDMERFQINLHFANKNFGFIRSFFGQPINEHIEYPSPIFRKHVSDGSFVERIIIKYLEKESISNEEIEELNHYHQWLKNYSTSLQDFDPKNMKEVLIVFERVSN